MENPLVEFSAAGERLSLRTVQDVDREPLTEYYAGILVEHFPEDYRTVFSRMIERREVPLTEQLRTVATEPTGVVVVISGIDYERLMLTSQSQIMRLI